MKTPLHVLKFPDKNFMLAFESENDQETFCFNNAIHQVMKEHDLHPFHQIGSDPFGGSEVGFNAWEAWANVTQEQMESLISEVTQRAAKLNSLW